MDERIEDTESELLRRMAEMPRRHVMVPSPRNAKALVELRRKGWVREDHIIRAGQPRLQLGFTLTFRGMVAARNLGGA